MRPQLFSGRASHVRHLTRCQMPQCDAQAVDVGASVGGLGIKSLLGSHVVNGPHDLSDARQLIPIVADGL